MKYELEYITTLQKTVKGKITRSKEITIKKMFNLENIEVEQFIEPKNGKVVNKYSSVYLGDVYYKINKPYLELKELVENQAIPIRGFAAKTKQNVNKQKNTNK